MARKKISPFSSSWRSFIWASAIAMGSLIPRTLLAQEFEADPLAYQVQAPPVDVFILTSPPNSSLSSQPKASNLSTNNPSTLPFMTSKQVQALALEDIQELVSQKLFFKKHAAFLSREQIKTLDPHTLEQVLPLLNSQQVPYLKGEQVTHLSPDMVKKILPFVPRYHIKFLQKSHLQALNSKEIKKVFDHLEEDQVPLVPPKLLTYLSKYKIAAKVHLLTSEQFKSLKIHHIEGIIDTGRINERLASLLPHDTLAQLSPFSFLDLVAFLPEDLLRFASAEQLSTLIHHSPVALSKVKRFSAQALAGISTSDFAALYSTLSSTQLKELYTHKLLSEHHIAALSASQLQATPSSFLAKLDLPALEKAIPSITKDQLKQLLSKNLGYLLALDYFTEERIRQLDTAVIKELHPENLTDILVHLTPDQLHYLNFHQIKGLRPENLQSLTLAQWQAFSKEMMTHLSLEQVQALRIDHIRSLDSDKIEVLIDKFEEGQLSFLLRHQLQAALDILPAEDLSHLPTESIEDLSLEFLHNLPAQKQLNFFKHFSHILSSQQFHALFPKIAPLLNSGELKISQAVLNQLSPQQMVEVIPLLAPSQLEKLQEKHFVEYLSLIEQHHLTQSFDTLIKVLPYETLSRLSSPSLKWMEKNYSWPEKHLQALSFSQIQGFSPSFLSSQLLNLSYEQVLSLSPELIEAMPGEFLSQSPQVLELFSLSQIQALTSEHLQFVRRELSSLETTKLKALLPKLQLQHLKALNHHKLFSLFSHLSPDQIQKLSWMPFGKVPLKALKDLKSSQVAAIPVQVLKQANFDQLQVLFSQLSLQQVKGLSTSIQWMGSTFLPQLQLKHLKALGPTFVNALTPKELALLKPQALKPLPTSFLLHLSDQTLSYLQPFLSSDTFKEAQHLKMKQNLPQVEITALSDQQLFPLLPYLSDTQFLSLPPERLNRISSNYLAAIPPEKFQLLARSWFQQLKPSQLKVLSPSHIAHIPSEVFAEVSAFLVDLSPEQIKALNSEQLKSLPFDIFIEFLPHLLPHQIASIAPQYFSRLSREDIHNLSLAQISGLQQTQIENFSSLQISAFSKSQMEAMNFFPSEETFLHLYSHDLKSNTASVEPSLIESPVDLPYPPISQLPTPTSFASKPSKNPFVYKKIPLNTDPTRFSSNWGYSSSKNHEKNH